MKEPVPGVFMIERTWGSNIYVIPGDGHTIIDAGFPLDKRRIIRSLKGASPRLIVATHYHIDHVGSIADLKSRYGSQVAAHEADAPVMEGTKPYQLFKLDPMRMAYYKVFSPLYRYKYVEVDLRLEEGDAIDALGGLEVVHLPGHTDGSIALYQQETGIVFSGDTIRNERGVLEGPPPKFSPGIEESFRHIREKVLELDFDILLPGHGEPLVGGAKQRVERMMWDCGRLTAISAEC